MRDVRPLASQCLDHALPNGDTSWCLCWQPFPRPRTSLGEWALSSP